MMNSMPKSKWKEKNKEVITKWSSCKNSLLKKSNKMNKATKKKWNLQIIFNNSKEKMKNWRLNSNEPNKVMKSHKKKVKSQTMKNLLPKTLKSKNWKKRSKT